MRVRELTTISWAMLSLAGVYLAGMFSPPAHGQRPVDRAFAPLRSSEGQASPPDAYLVEMNIFRVKPSKAERPPWLEAVWPSGGNENDDFFRGVHHLQGTRCTDCHEASEELLGRQLAMQLDKSREHEEVQLRKWTHEADVVARPSLVVTEGRQGLLKLSTGKPSVDYLFREEDGRFALKSVANEAGVSVRVSVKPAPDKAKTLNAVQLTVLLELTELAQRQPVAEVDLPIGRPVFGTRAVSTSLLIEPGRLTAVPSPVGQDATILFLARVTRHEPKPTADESPGKTYPKPILESK